MLRQFYIVIAVDSENLLHHVALTVNIYHIRRSSHFCAALTLLDEIVSEVGQYVFNDIVTDFLADESLDPVIVQVNDFFLNRSRI